MQKNALILSILYENIELAKSLLMIENIDIYQEGYLTGTALCLALLAGDADLSQLLIKKEKDGFQPEKHPDLWFCAVSSGSQQCIKLLIQAGLDPNKPSPGIWRYHPKWVWKVEKEYLNEGLCFPLDEYSYYNNAFGKSPLVYAKENDDSDMQVFLQTCISEYNEKKLSL